VSCGANLALCLGRPGAGSPTAAALPPPGARVAFLKSSPPQKGPVRRIPLTLTPFRIGRSVSCQFVIASSQVSKVHAEIFRIGEDYRIRDLGSTNGIFVNGHRVNETPLADDDIFHVAHEELRFVLNVDADTEEKGHTEPLLGK